MSFSTSQAAKMLGIGIRTLSRYVAEGKVPAPTIIQAGGNTVHVWAENEVENVRKLLPEIANGRKTRWQKQRDAQRKKQVKKKQ
jgi:hypothetical protein